MSAIVYARENILSADDYVRVVGESALGRNRPLNDRARVEAMLRGSNLIITARLGGECVGLGRCLTDFAWVAYLADLAVSERHQGKGIGRGLMLKLREELGDRVGLALLSMPDARPFYDAIGPSIGLRTNDSAYWMTRVRGV